MKKHLGAALAGIIALVAATFAVAHLTGVEATGNHTNGNGNPTCADIGFLHLVKVDPPVDGVAAGYFFNFSFDGEEVDISDAVSVPGTPVPFDRAIVKGGSNSNYRIYSFNEATSANDLETGTGQDISHVTLCYDADATATPTNTATPTFTPTATATATPTFTPTATATDTPEPTATNTPEPTATNTPDPTSTPTCEQREDCPTNTPTATPTDDCCDDRPTRTPTNTPVPPTSTPVPPTATPTGEVPPDAPTVTPEAPVVLRLPDSGSGPEASDTRAARFFIGGALFAAAIILGAFFVFRGVSRPD